MDPGTNAIVLYEKEKTLAIRPIVGELVLRESSPEYSGKITMDIPPANEHERREDHLRRYYFRGVDELRRQQKISSCDPPAPKKLNHIL